MALINYVSTCIFFNNQNQTITMLYVAYYRTLYKRGYFKLIFLFLN